MEYFCIHFTVNRFLHKNAASYNYWVQDFWKESEASITRFSSFLIRAVHLTCNAPKTNVISQVNTNTYSQVKDMSILVTSIGFFILAHWVNKACCTITLFGNLFQYDILFLIIYHGGIKWHKFGHPCNDQSKFFCFKKLNICSHVSIVVTIADLKGAKTILAPPPP